MLTLKNNTGSFSKVGAVVMQDPKSKDAFVYAMKGSTRVLGVVLESVPYRASCKVATQGDTAKVLTTGNVVKGATLRLGKTTDNISLGLAMIAKTGDSPYLKVGDALNFGAGSTIEARIDPSVSVNQKFHLFTVGEETAGGGAPAESKLKRWSGTEWISVGTIVVKT